MKELLLTLFIVFTFSCTPTKDSTILTKLEIKADLEYLDQFIQTHSSYQGLNGYDYKRILKDF